MIVNVPSIFYKFKAKDIQTIDINNIKVILTLQNQCCQSNWHIHNFYYNYFNVKLKLTYRFRNGSFYFIKHPLHLARRFTKSIIFSTHFWCCFSLISQLQQSDWSWLFFHLINCFLVFNNKLYEPNNSCHINILKVQIIRCFFVLFWIITKIMVFN